MPINLEPYFDDYATLNAAHDAYLAHLTSKVAGENDAAAMALRLSVGLQHHVDRLNQAFDRGDVPRSLTTDWRADAKVFVGKAGRQFCMRTLGGQCAVLIDYDLLSRLVLFVYLVGIDKDDDVAAQILASFLLLSIIVPRDEEFPRLSKLLHLAALHDARVINDICSIVGDFILFHELGHAYVKQCGGDFVRAVYSLPDGIDVTPENVHSIQFLVDGPLFNHIDLSGTQNGLLLIGEKFECWKHEFAPDIFAVYAALVAPAASRPQSVDLERLVESLSCWQLVLYVISCRVPFDRKRV